MEQYTKASTVNIGSREWEELLRHFEDNIGKVIRRSCDFTKEGKENWPLGYFYCNGVVNDAFNAYMAGYVFGKSQYRDNIA